MNIVTGIIFVLICCAIGWLVGHGASFLFEKFETIINKHPFLLFLIVAIVILVIIVGVSAQH